MYNTSSETQGLLAGTMQLIFLGGSLKIFQKFKYPGGCPEGMLKLRLTGT